MRDELLTYYERELGFLRQMGAEYAQQYPKIAGRLAIEPDKCEDPHVERMLEGFALLAGRIQLKIDDDFPEVSQALLNAVYPHYLRPIPSMSVAEMEVDPEQVPAETGLRLPRGTSLVTRAVDGVACRFRTCSDVTFWPVEVAEAQWREADRSAAGAFHIELRTHKETPFSNLPIEALRFYINGPSDTAHTIYELIANSCGRVMVEGKTAAIRTIGFEEDDAALPYPARSFAGYRLLQEYFALPQKFLFFEIGGLRATLAGTPSDRIGIQIVIAPFERAERRDALESGVSARTFRLGCAPVINLFGQTAEPILFDHSRSEYPVVPDATRRQAMEVFSVEEAAAADPRTREIDRFEPFYALRHSGGNPGRRYFRAMRRPPARPQDRETEVWLSFVNAQGLAAPGAPRSVTVRTLCTNGDLPAKLPLGQTAGDFEVEGPVPVKRATALVRPTPTLRPALGEGMLWRLISQLSLNYLSLVEDGGDALKELLRLYNFNPSVHAEKQIEGVAAVRSRRRFAVVSEEDGASFARGTEVEIEFDEQQFVGGGVYLFAAVLERFLGQYVGMNSFCRLRARTRQRKEELAAWAARAGRRKLL